MKKSYETPIVICTEYANDIITTSNFVNENAIKTDWDFFEENA